MNNDLWKDLTEKAALALLDCLLMLHKEGLPNDAALFWASLLGEDHRGIADFQAGSKQRYGVDKPDNGLTPGDVARNALIVAVHARTQKWNIYDFIEDDIVTAIGELGIGAGER